MDINSLTGTQLLTPVKSAENPLNLKVGQQLDVKISNTEIQAVKTAITLSIGDKNATVQSNRPIELPANQTVKLLVSQVAPSVEFKILEPPELAQDPALRLKLITVTKDGTATNTPTQTAAKESGNAAINNAQALKPTVTSTGTEPSLRQPAPAATDKPAATPAPNPGPSPIPVKPDASASTPALKLAFDAKILDIVGEKIQLQVSGAKQNVTLTVDKSQLADAGQNLKIGQTLTLEMTKTGSTASLRVIPNTADISEAKVTEFVKQFLPKHEAPPILLNQLIKDLPKLMENPSVSQALKDIAAKIIANLPPKEQLVDSRTLKQAVVNSGVFLEARLPSLSVPPELIDELPQLIRNETVPQSLQRIAAEILQNLASTEQADEPTLTGKPKTLNETASGTPVEPKESQPSELTNKDFKASLLKFIHELKQEINTHAERQLAHADTELLKSLQHKTENAVAKLVLDQLMSLPKDDSPKQVWIIDLPFVDRQQAESVKIEIQRDKENQQQTGGHDWSVTITITPPGLGSIHCIVSYRNEVVNTYFKSKENRTTSLIQHNLDYLKNRLEESGLKTGHIDAHNDNGRQLLPAREFSETKLFDDKA